MITHLPNNQSVAMKELGFDIHIHVKESNHVPYKIKVIDRRDNSAFGKVFYGGWWIHEDSKLLAVTESPGESFSARYFGPSQYEICDANPLNDQS